MKASLHGEPQVKLRHLLMRSSELLLLLFMIVGIVLRLLIEQHLHTRMFIVQRLLLSKRLHLLLQTSGKMDILITLISISFVWKCVIRHSTKQRSNWKNLFVRRKFILHVGAQSQVCRQIDAYPSPSRPPHTLDHLVELRTYVIIMIRNSTSQKILSH